MFLSLKMVLDPLLSEGSADVKKDVEISTSFSAVASFPATRRPGDPDIAVAVRIADSSQ